MSDTPESSRNNDINVADLVSVTELSGNETNRRKSKRRRETNGKFCDFWVDEMVW